MNRKEIDRIILSRGLRQGDPLSPYLFILYAEGLSALFCQAELHGHIHGIRITPKSPSITHLLFADDSFFFFRANSEESQYVKHLLSQYASVSGQAVNFLKSGIYFS